MERGGGEKLQPPRDARSGNPEMKTGPSEVRGAGMAKLSKDGSSVSSRSQRSHRPTHTTLVRWRCRIVANRVYSVHT